MTHVSRSRMKPDAIARTSGPKDRTFLFIKAGVYVLAAIALGLICYGIFATVRSVFGRM